MVSQTYTLMLVEDDQALRSGLRELFEREGYRVVAASCVQEARNLFDAHIHLIVLDVTLPDGNGVALCQEWRNQGVTTPILFLTAKDEEFDVVRGLDAGGNDYVTKPFRMMELLSRIRALLRTSRSQVSSTLSRSGVEVDQEHMQVRKNGEPLQLTLTEYSVSDNGGGVDAKELPHLFDRFYRAHSRETKGAGIGLSIVKEIIRRHHGSIYAENIPGGLRMNITLPILQMIRT